jgi:hypothetical protein
VVLGNARERTLDCAPCERSGSGLGARGDATGAGRGPHGHPLPESPRGRGGAPRRGHRRRGPPRPGRRAPRRGRALRGSRAPARAARRCTSPSSPATTTAARRPAPRPSCPRGRSRVVFAVRDPNPHVAGGGASTRSRRGGRRAGGLRRAAARGRARCSRRGALHHRAARARDLEGRDVPRRSHRHAHRREPLDHRPEARARRARPARGARRGAGGQRARCSPTTRELTARRPGARASPAGGDRLGAPHARQREASPGREAPTWVSRGRGAPATSRRGAQALTAGGVRVDGGGAATSRGPARAGGAGRGVGALRGRRRAPRRAARRGPRRPGGVLRRADAPGRRRATLALRGVGFARLADALRLRDVDVRRVGDDLRIEGSSDVFTGIIQAVGGCAARAARALGDARGGSAPSRAGARGERRGRRRVPHGGRGGERRVHRRRERRDLVAHDARARRAVGARGEPRAGARRGRPARRAHRGGARRRRRRGARASEVGRARSGCGFERPREVLRFVAEKGSVAIDGVSLTVNAVDDAGLRGDAGALHARRHRPRRPRPPGRR